MGAPTVTYNTPSITTASTPLFVIVLHTFLSYNHNTELTYIPHNFMSYTGRPKKLPSQKYDKRVKINLTESQMTKLDRLCADLGVTHTEYFRSFLAKDKR
jgi:hypothetical protein